MNNRIGIDIGYGYTKTSMGDVTKSFQTAVSVLGQAATFSSFSPVSVGGRKFLVGEEAARESKGLIDTRSAGFLLSEPWLAILGHALAINHFQPDNGAIVLGIPPGEYTKSLATKISEDIKRASIQSKEFGDPIDFSNTTIRVIPQGAGIYFSYLNDHPEDIQKNVAVVDIGHFTADMIFFAGGKYVESATETKPLGTSGVLDDIIRQFYRKHRFSIQYPEARKLLNGQSITRLGTDYRIDNISEIVSPYMQQLSSVIDNFFEKVSVPEIGVAGGGGVFLVRNYIKLKNKLTVINNPEMANAIGYYLYSKN